MNARGLAVGSLVGITIGVGTGLAPSATAGPPAGGATAAVTLLSPGGTGDAGVDFAGVSGDGRHVYLQTRERLTADDGDATFDVFDRAGGATTLISSGGPGTFGSAFGGSSEDGSRAFFMTMDPVVAADRDQATDVYQRAQGSTRLLTGGSRRVHAYFLAASRNGARVVFRSSESLVPEDTDRTLDVYQAMAGGLELISTGGHGEFGATFGAASADGRKVAFSTRDSLTRDDVDGGQRDVYRSSGGRVTLVSGPGNEPVGAAFRGMSADGSRMAFVTRAALSPQDRDGGRSDVYLWDGSQARLVSGPGSASYAGMTPDGRTVFFQTRDSLTGEDRDGGFVDVYARSDGTTRLVSAGDGPWDAHFEGAATDGRRTFFSTDESLAVQDADGGRSDVYERDGRDLLLVSSGKNGPFDAQYDGTSPDGSRVLFSTREALVPNDRDGQLTDIYAVKDGATRLMTPASDHSDAVFRGLGPSGRVAFFESYDRLSPSDGDNGRDVYSAQGAD